MTRKRYSELNRPARVRKVAASFLGSAASLTLLIVIYYAAPLDRGLETGTVIRFGIGLLGFVGVITWQMRAITRSHLPRLRAIQAFATGFPLLLVLYAATYILIGHNQPDSFSEELSRTDSLYFTVTVFATSGSATSRPAPTRTTTGRASGLESVLMRMISSRIWCTEVLVDSGNLTAMAVILTATGRVVDARGCPPAARAG